MMKSEVVAIPLDKVSWPTAVDADLWLELFSPGGV
jgi:hypothetical protein